MLPQLILRSKKQIQRHIKAWGFVKNVSSQDMLFMHTKSKRRLEDEGKNTRFKRRCENGQFQEIPPEKIGTWRKRFQDDQETDEPRGQSRLAYFRLLDKFTEMHRYTIKYCLQYSHED